MEESAPLEERGELGGIEVLTPGEVPTEEGEEGDEKPIEEENAEEEEKEEEEEEEEGLVVVLELALVLEDEDKEIAKVDVIDEEEYERVVAIAEETVVPIAFDDRCEESVVVTVAEDNSSS